MRALIQRVREASVTIEGARYSGIGSGMLILLGVAGNDTPADAEYLARRCTAVRIFEDEGGKMNRSLTEAGGSLLVVSQFTLYADTSRGNRPGFTGAAPPALAEQLYNRFVALLSADLGGERVRTGVFGAMMDVALINDGPVTIMIESKNHES
ncbi:MAG TPA: D-aminoacyl-tRNA deacylase [Bacteroidota bacterium]|nr:D-aminoacyl-tRNA deacylase [Bacteroidota bacterium]